MMSSYPPTAPRAIWDTVGVATGAAYGIGPPRPRPLVDPAARLLILATVSQRHPKRATVGATSRRRLEDGRDEQGRGDDAPRRACQQVEVETSRVKKKTPREAGSKR
jgi:hypothetical protein